MTRPFHLLRWFSLLSLFCIILISSVSAYLLSGFLADRILWRDAEVSMNFIESIVQAENTWSYFVSHDNARVEPILESFFNHLAHMPDVVRANVYDMDRTVLWSNHQNLIGQHLPDNLELETSLAGQLVVESGIVGVNEKTEHVDLESKNYGLQFVETYIPIWDGDHQAVVGSVELYRLPHQLQNMIAEGTRLVWLSALVGGVLLYATLFWMVRRASVIMNTQQLQLIESENLAMIGETASAIAHGIRNPLASIRASAELTLDDDLEGAKESATDIISETDRLDRWARELLLFSRLDTFTAEPIALDSVLHSSINEFENSLKQHKITLKLDLPENLPTVRGNAIPLGQVFSCLIANAIDAMPEDGTLHVSGAFDAARSSVNINIRDTGPGLSAELLDKVFRPFFSTKQNGTGLGLALSRRIAQRYGGTLELESSAAEGVTAVLNFPAAG